MRVQRVWAVVAVALLAGCHRGSTHGQEPTPAYGTIQPAALGAALDADGVATDLTIADTFQGTTYGEEGEAFVLTVDILVDGTVIDSIPLQYLITAGSPGDGTFVGTVTVDLGMVASGSHTISVTVESPADFYGANDGAAALTVAEPLPAAHG